MPLAVPLTRGLHFGVFAALAGLLTAAGRAAESSSLEQAWLKGDYDAAISDGRSRLKSGEASTADVLALVRTLLTVGRDTDADQVISAAIARDPLNVRFRWLARDVALANNRPEEAAQRPMEIRRLIGGRPWNYRRAEDMVVFGRAALLLGADPKDVLDKVYTPAQTADPKLRDVYLARGDLALEKHDYALAAKVFDQALKQIPGDPDLLCGRAKAYADSDRKTALAALRDALAANPRHVPSLLELADHDIDAEAYADAEKELSQAIAVNARQPEAWAYRAVLAHLRHDDAGEQEAHARALSTWETNPAVDALIGRKLAQKYRFFEAAAYQRRALALDPEYLPGSAELATDLLRLGDEDEGWTIAQTVHTRDAYDVEAYNLVTLHDSMAKYAALTSPDFVVRMSAREVGIYGPRVLALLRRAKATLTAKYGVELASPTYVEIFADPKDFAVRTFGLPDISGFLGVCFGRVVTANSPASSTSPVDWESVLWHEFCHAVTLQLTKNRMPRWLSEGISVYEERQADPARGMALNARYRQMILGEDLVPVSQLSAAFLAPKTPEHLQFAYLESSLVVEFIVAHYGVDHLRGVLRSLRDGEEINAALAKNTAPLGELEKAFAVYAREQARQLAPKLDWEKPDPELLAPDGAAALARWEQKHPGNYWLLKLRAAEAVDAEQWPVARAALERLVTLYPQQKGSDSAYRPLVKVLHAMNDPAAERTVLTKWAASDDEAPDAYLRLMEIGAAANDWALVRQNVDRYLAVNPLVPAPYRYLASACAAAHDVSGGITAWRTLLQLDPADPADAHFQLARLLHERGENTQAKREVLQALEDTPRFRAALHLLTDIENAGADEPAGLVVPLRPRS